MVAKNRSRTIDKKIMPQTSRTRVSKQQLSMEVLKSFRVIFGSVRHHFREVERVSGISGSQAWILQELARSQGNGVSELAAKLAIHQSTCSLLIEKLVRKGFVTRVRDADDGRRVVLAISSRGRKVLSKAPGPAEGVLPEALADLTNTQLQRLRNGLRNVIDALDIKDEKSADRPLSDL